MGEGQQERGPWAGSSGDQQGGPPGLNPFARHEDLSREGRARAPREDNSEQQPQGLAPPPQADVDAVREAFPDWLREFDERMLEENPWSILGGGDMHQLTQWIMLPLWTSGSVQEARERVNEPMTRVLAEHVEHERALKRDPDRTAADA